MPHPVAHDQPLKVLVVDDEQDAREYLARLLEVCGYDPLEADSGESALYALAKTPDVRLVLLDWMMPQMSGLDVLTQLRENYCDLPVLMLSARTEQQDILRAVEFGANDYLLKPVSKDTLEAKVRSILNDARQSLRLRAGRRKNVSMPAFGSLQIAGLTAHGLWLLGNFPVADGSPFILSSDALTRLLDLRADTRYACRVTHCHRDGRKYAMLAEFLNPSADLTARLEKLREHLRKEQQPNP